jgi:hypothetical protein
MADPEHLRRMAERMLAAAMESPDEDTARAPTVRASEYLDQASALEAARPASEAREQVSQKADEPQPNEQKE